MIVCTYNRFTNYLSIFTHLSHFCCITRYISDILMRFFILNWKFNKKLVKNHLNLTRNKYQYDIIKNSYKSTITRCYKIDAVFQPYKISRKVAILSCKLKVSSYQYSWESLSKNKRNFSTTTGLFMNWRFSPSTGAGRLLRPEPFSWKFFTGPKKYRYSRFDKKCLKFEV